jgi:hypothetical protein
MGQCEESLDFCLITQIDGNLLINPETDKGVFYVDYSIYFRNWILGTNY